jgi:hypothetical protein
MNLKARDKKAAIREMIQHLVQGGQLKEKPPARRRRRCRNVRAKAPRDRKGWRSRTRKAALSSKKCTACSHARGRAYLSTQWIGANVHVLFLVVSPEEQMSEHVNIMRRIAKMHTDEKTLKFLASNTILESLEEILKEVDDSFS